ncbi:PDI1 [[Candida] subhashii]|uniref:Protein disulfide-isomerase n=1 Tax=[Candida] subhashii TaxID=561895 RepID=A0A8J5QDV0_9ASCO|nr:PDI1 [[Candida] subhashii]KAG7660427.1 PDI1 [[Candida] subhashii]
MKFWKLSSNALATLLAIVSITQASGPSDGDAVADPNSAVVKLTTANFESFMQENPLVLAEFFAPWCGYCKMLAPEFSKAADKLNESNPKIKLGQVDCTVEEQICQQFGIKGYPTLKIFRGDVKTPQDYDGPREADGIADFMIKQSLPAVSQPATEEELFKLVDGQVKPFVIQVNPSKESNVTFNKIAETLRKDHTFINVENNDLIGKLNKKLTKLDISGKKPSILVIHPSQLDDAVKFEGKSFTTDEVKSFIETEAVPYFGDIDRDTYMSYMTSPLPLAYYFYNTEEERKEIAANIEKLAKKHRGKINFAGLNAKLYGKHAEVINMDPEVFPLFAIHEVNDNKKYGVDQTKHPKGPSIEVIEQFVEDYFQGKLTPIIKSEDLPTEEEKLANPVVKLVAHNYREILDDVSKDIFVKYYAPWCGHCKKLAPIWEEVAQVYGSNKPDAKVLIADIDQTNNDVDVPYPIQGYPTLLLYPANGKIDEKTGIREPILFEGARDFDSLLSFVKDSGALHVDGFKLKEELDATKNAIVEEDEEEVKAEEKPKADEKEQVAHDEL